jgi:2-C-methyl-D-erythritol 4-phosphate cytidylyltransferase
VADALATAAEKSGRIDHVVYVAEAPPAGALAELAPDVAAQALGGGCAGALHVARAALPYLRRTHGHLLFCTPPADPAAAPGLHAVTRSAIAALARTLAAAWAADGVRVNCVDAAPSAPRPALAVLASGLTGEVLGTAG